ncbi:MAG: peptide chain release factor N(5)-glutamine methyltransferase [Steroidobacteraceae bacterium]
MTVSGDASLLERILTRLRSDLPLAPDKPEETVETTAYALWHTAAGHPCSAALAIAQLPALDQSQKDRLDKLLERRLAGEPLAYLTGRQAFLGLEFHTSPGALIPRRETELLGTEALRLLGLAHATRPNPKVLDLCTGSGNLAIAIACRFPAAELWAADLEATALELAEQNARHHGVRDRVRLLQGDLFGALSGTTTDQFDLITCNPPYLTTRHAQNMPRDIGAAEPVAAFDGGPFGVSITLRLIREAPRFLAPAGWLCFELGAGQGPMIEKRLRDNSSYVDFHSISDSNGVVRSLCARVA